MRNGNVFVIGLVYRLETGESGGKRTGQQKVREDESILRWWETAETQCGDRSICVWEGMAAQWTCKKSLVQASYVHSQLVNTSISSFFNYLTRGALSWLQRGRLGESKLISKLVY